MTTLITVKTSDGCVGRCDARCYDATTSECCCVCGGRNHGIGEKQAFANTREHAEKMIANYAKLKNQTDFWGLVPDEVRQIPLFEEV